jgi:hypothetical protein
MADTVVEVPGIGPVAFPESMSQGEIEQAAAKLYRSQQSGASRFVSGAVSAVNPMPLVSQLADVVKDPVGQAFGLKPGLQNLKSALHAQLDQAITAAQTAKKALDGEGDAGTWQGKLMAASEALGHGVAAVVPVFGPAAAHAGERIAEGDTAGGLGEGAGLVGSVVAPRVIPKVAGATDHDGRRTRCDQARRDGARREPRWSCGSCRGLQRRRCHRQRDEEGPC